MSKKPFYKSWWFWLIVIGTLLCVANIVCSLIFKGEDGANIFTAVSGWVSGIATAILGVIAVVQNRKYKEENDSYLLAQDQREWRLEQKEILKMYLNNIIEIYQEVQKYQYSKVINECIKNLDKEPYTIDDIAYVNILKCLYNRITYVLLNNIYYIDGTEELLNKNFIYFSNLTKILNDVNFECCNLDFLDELYSQYQPVVEGFNKYILTLQTLIGYNIVNADPEDVEKLLNEMRTKQIAWREKMKKQLNEEQKNG